MDRNIRVVLSYLSRFSSLADSSPGFISGGMAPSLSAIETLPHSSYSNTSSGMEFIHLQNDLIDNKRKRKRKKKYVV